MIAISAAMIAGSPRAEDLPTYSITLKNHRFTPSEIHVPSGKPFFVLVTNADDTADEFEMNAPAVEKLIPPGAQGKVRIRPLGPGRFKFFGDFHQETAQGAFVSE
jgi:heme/copper-type cytochrome/quinol oxidase subunit 2